MSEKVRKDVDISRFGDFFIINIKADSKDKRVQDVKALLDKCMNKIRLIVRNADLKALMPKDVIEMANQIITRNDIVESQNKDEGHIQYGLNLNSLIALFGLMGSGLEANYESKNFDVIKEVSAIMLTLRETIANLEKMPVLEPLGLELYKNFQSVSIKVKDKDDKTVELNLKNLKQLFLYVLMFVTKNGSKFPKGWDRKRVQIFYDGLELKSEADLSVLAQDAVDFFFIINNTLRNDFTDVYNNGELNILGDDGEIVDDKQIAERVEPCVKMITILPFLRELEQFAIKEYKANPIPAELDF